MTADPMNVQHGGSHYKGLAIEPFEISLANQYDGAIHSIVKYVTRHHNKGGAEDLWKAHHICAIRRKMMGVYGTRPSLPVISMGRYIEENGVAKPEALILRNTDFWSRDPQQADNLSGHDFGACGMIQQQIADLIQHTYPTT